MFMFRSLSKIGLYAVIILMLIVPSVSAQEQYSEAPMLAEQVAQGALPPVSERLPVEPLVVEPVESVGVYGGELRFADAGVTALWSSSQVRQSGLFRYTQDGATPVLDIAKSYSFSDDLKTFSLVLREGHKWSDGSPFTVDDILFWWEDVANNPELSPNGPGAFWTFDEGPVVFEKISDVELNINFPIAYPIVLDRFGRTFFSSDTNIFLPKHYLSNWHPSYNEEAAAIATEEGFETWVQAFQSHSTPSRWYDTERPWLWAWIPQEETTDRVVFVRNPYYHAVDTEGQQLPYIDRIIVTPVNDLQTLTLMASTGELDFEAYFLGLSDMPVLRANEEAGNYQVYLANSLRTSDLALMPNQNAADPVLRELFQNLDFRRAMSLGINRERMNETLYFGLGTPYPGIPLAANSYVKPEWTTMNIEYNVDEANAILDSIGLTERDSDGFRLRSDGERLSMVIEIGVLEGRKMDACQLVAEDYVAIGIEAICTLTEGSLFTQRHNANELEVPTWHLDRAALFGRANPLFFGWEDATQQRWGPLWAQWFQSAGAQGEEPPQEIKDLEELFRRWQGTEAGSEEFTQLGQQYFEYFATQLPIIGTVGMFPQPLVVSNRLKNVATEGIFWGSDTNFYAPYLPAQWYIQE